jgi:hypothetical protein
VGCFNLYYQSNLSSISADSDKPGLKDHPNAGIFDIREDAASSEKY